jgi:hypothetical protein
MKYLIVMNYNSAKIEIIEINGYDLDLDEFLQDRGYNLDEIHYMTCNEIVIESK